MEELDRGELGKAEVEVHILAMQNREYRSCWDQDLAVDAGEVVRHEGDYFL